MARVTGDIVIDRPVSEVFDFMLDQRNEPLYNPRMLSSEKLDEGEVSVGTRFRVRMASRGSTPMTVQILSCDRPRSISSSTTMAWGEVTGGITLDPAGHGTHMHWSWDVKLRGALRLLGPLVAVMGRRQEQDIWSGLKALLEAGGPAIRTEGREVSGSQP